MRLMCDSQSSVPAILAMEAVDNMTNEIVGRGHAAVDVQARGWQQLPLKIDVRGTNGHSVRFRLVSPGALGVSLASIDIPVDYGFTVVDLSEPLNTFNTHASSLTRIPTSARTPVMAKKCWPYLSGFADAPRMFRELRARSGRGGNFRRRPYLTRSSPECAGESDRGSEDPRTYSGIWVASPER